MELYQAMKKRRSNYNLTSSSPISDSRIREILSDAITYPPSAFHSQSSRVVLLLSERHKKFWSLVEDTLRAIVPAASFGSTQAKLASFAAGHGTILYLEDMSTVEKLQQDFPLYAENFPVWSNQSAGMLQYAVWTALSQEGLGASLQHYNPLVDAAAAKEFDLPENWKLLAQMPFGAPSGEPAPIAYMPIEERLVVQGGETP